MSRGLFAFYGMLGLVPLSPDHGGIRHGQLDSSRTCRALWSSARFACSARRVGLPVHDGLCLLPGLRPTGNHPVGGEMSPVIVPSANATIAARSHAAPIAGDEARISSECSVRTAPISSNAIDDRPRPHHHARAPARGSRRGAAPEDARRVRRAEGGAGESARVHRGRQGARRRARPCPVLRPAGARQDDAGADRRARARRRLPRHLGAGDRQVGRSRRLAHQSRGWRRPVHRRDPPARAARSRRSSIRRWRTGCSI